MNTHTSEQSQSEDMQGPGNVRFMLAPVHVIEDDGVAIRPGRGGFDVMRLRTVYYHEANTSHGVQASYADAVSSNVVTRSP